MKKIGIVTIHNSPNYGACLQAYALYKYIELKGLDVEIIDIHRPVHDDFCFEKEYMPYRNNQYSRKNRIINSIKKYIYNLLQGQKKIKSLYTSKLAEKRFIEFNSEIKYSKAYNKLSFLKKNPPIYDLYISGSDQLWNPTQPYCLEPYFLTFVPPNKKKISLATSIGVTWLTEKEKCDFKKWLEEYDAISVREKQAKLLLDSFVDKEIVQVADPTFLLDVSYWREIAKYPSAKDKYILLFLLHAETELINYAIRLSKNSGYKLVIMKNSSLKENPESYELNNDCGPLEFLGYIGKAEMVITDSFHCTVFSLLMGANNFFSYINKSSKRGSRITDLLEIFGLQDHILPIDLSIEYDTLLQCKVNKNEAERIIDIEKNKLRLFLDNWIK